MAIELKGDTFKDIEFTSYNNLNRVESLNLLSGEGLIRMGKYSSQKHRQEKPSDLIENRDFHTIKLSEEDLTGLKKTIYKYITELDCYKEGTKV